MAPKTFPSLTYTDRVEIFIYLRNLVPPKGQRFFFFSSSSRTFKKEPFQLKR